MPPPISPFSGNLGLSASVKASVARDGGEAKAIEAAAREAKGDRQDTGPLPILAEAKALDLEAIEMPGTPAAEAPKPKAKLKRPKAQG